MQGDSTVREAKLWGTNFHLLSRETLCSCLVSSEKRNQRFSTRKKPVSLTLPLLCQMYGEGNSPPTRFDLQQNIGKLLGLTPKTHVKQTSVLCALLSQTCLGLSSSYNLIVRTYPEITQTSSLGPMYRQQTLLHFPNPTSLLHRWLHNKLCSRVVL